MKLTTKGRYAVMAMADLALHSKGRPVSLADVAGRQGISLSYLEQLFARLRRGELVTSVRGPGGGYLLARDMGEIRIADIVLAADERITVTRCRPNSTQGCLTGTGRCITHDLWDELGRHIQLFLSSVSLGEVVEGRIGGQAAMPALGAAGQNEDESPERAAAEASYAAE